MEAFPEDGSLFDVERPAAAVDLPARLSPSRAGDFTQCPLMFRFRVIDKIPEPPSLAATRGTLVHAVLERLFDLPIGRRTPDEAAALIAPQWDKLVGKHPELQEMFATPEELAEWLESAKGLLGKYFTMEDPNRLEPAERELFVRAEVGGPQERLELRGVVDRLDIAPGGLLRVVDYKTGKAPTPGYEAKTLFQMKFYALILWRSRGTIPKRLQLMFMGGAGDVLRYDPTEKDLLGTEKKILAIWQAISTAAQQREWPATPTKLCGWCSFKPICPAHGGSCPPAPEVNLVPLKSAVSPQAPGAETAAVQVELEPQA
jgi:putative RecB family exonuclease